MSAKRRRRARATRPRSRAAWLPAALLLLAACIVSYTLCTCTLPTISIRITDPVQVRGAHVVVVPDGIVGIPAVEPPPEEPPRRFPEGL